MPDRPTPDEIEVTPAMIAAGISELPFSVSSALGILSEEILVSQVYRAMDVARNEGPR